MDQELQREKKLAGSRRTLYSNGRRTEARYVCTHEMAALFCVK